MPKLRGPAKEPDCRSVTNALVDATSIKLGNSPTIPIAIIVEQIGPPRLSFEIALREALNIYAGRFYITDKANLVIHVTGTAVEHARDEQHNTIEIITYSDGFVQYNGKTKLIRL